MATGTTQRPPFNPSTPSKHVAKGHDSILKKLQDSKAQTKIVAMSGEEFNGIIVGRDKFTITLLVDGTREVFYKHAIERFSSKERA